MKNKIMIIVLLTLSSALLWSQPYEITEIDIFDLKKSYNAKDILVLGISIEETISEALQKLGKNISDLYFTGENLCFLDIAPGARIRSTDMKTIEAILIFPEFQKYLKGKTAAFFNLTALDETIDFLTTQLGQPDYRKPLRWKDLNDENDYFFYLNGFIFFRSYSTVLSKPELSLNFEIITKEGLLATIERKY